MAKSGIIRYEETEHRILERENTGAERMKENNKRGNDQSTTRVEM